MMKNSRFGGAGRVLLVATLLVLCMGTVSAFAGGDGSSSNPYEIETCSQLENVDSDNNADYELISDIDCSSVSNFDPIGGGGDGQFSGTFYGNNHIISNLHVDAAGERAGLFGHTDSSSTLQNFGVKNGDVYGGSSDFGGKGGGIAGDGDGTIKQVFYTGSVNIASGYQIGGISGMDTGTIENSWTNADVASESNSGGVIGRAYGTVSDVYAYGSASEGVIGNDQGVSLTDAYYRSGGAGGDAAGATALTESEMTYPNAIDNMAFDFQNIWERDDGGINKGYPLNVRTNSPPSIDSVSTSPSSWTLGSDVNVSADVVDGDGTVSGVSADVWEDGTKIVGDASLSDSDGDGTWNIDNLFTVSQTDVDYKIELTATDDDGATEKYTETQTIEDSSEGLKVAKPKNQTYGTNTVPFDVYLNDDGDDVENESATCSLELDGSQFTSFSLKEGGSHQTGNFNADDGVHNFRASCTEDEGNTSLENIFREFTVDTGPPNVTIVDPAEGSQTNSTTGIPLNYKITDEPNLDSSSCKYSKDGGTNFSISSCGNTTVQYGSTGQHNISVFAEDTLGNRGQDTVQFTADTKNTLTATDKVTNVQLDNIEARFSNGTSVLEKSVNDSSLEFFTSNIPKGDVNFTVSITGFREKTRTLQNVDKSFNQDISVSLERAGLGLNVFNEEKPDTDLIRTVIFSNSTSKQQLNKTVFPTDYGDVNTETIQEYNSRTYLDQNKNTPVTAGKLIFDTPYFVGGGELEYNVFVNGDFEKTVKAFNKDSATVKLDEPKRITSLRLEAENRDDGDTYDESATAQAENFRVKAPDKGRTVIDFNALQNSKIPTGQDIEITVEGPENFVTRSYFTDITENSKTTLDAFLLKENQGILMTVEARGPENEPVNDALVTVQFQKDNKFKTVAQKKTASDGSAALRLSPNRQYKLDVKKTGLQSFSGTFSPANYQFDPLKIRLGETNNFQKSNTWDSIEFKLLPRTQKLNESPKLNFSVVDSETGITSFGIKVKNSNGTIIDSSLVSGSSSGGSTTLQPNLSNLNNVEIEGFFVKEEEEYKVERDYQVKRSLSPGVASISNIANSFNTVSQGTRSLLAVLVTGFVAFSLKSRVNKKGGSIVTISTLGLFVLIGWIPAFYWMLSLLAIIGILSIR